MKRRSPVGLVILTVLTFGLYSLHWFNDLRSALEDNTTERVPSIWWLPAPMILYFFGIISLLFGLTGGSSQNLVLNTTCQTQSCLTNSSSAIGHPGLFLFGIALILIGLMYSLTVNLYWYFNLAKGVNQYTSGRMKVTPTVAWLVLLLPVGVALVQDGINLTLDHGSSPPSPLASPPKEKGKDKGAPPPAVPPPSAAPKEMLIG